MKKNMIRPLAFYPPFIGMIIFISMGVFFTDSLGGFLNNALTMISENFGWLFMLVGLTPHT